jgi:hypothetical protein
MQQVDGEKASTGRRHGTTKPRRRHAQDQSVQEVPISGQSLVEVPSTSELPTQSSLLYERGARDGNIEDVNNELDDVNPEIAPTTRGVEPQMRLRTCQLAQSSLRSGKAAAGEIGQADRTNAAAPTLHLSLRRTSAARTASSVNHLPIRPQRTAGDAALVSFMGGTPERMNKSARSSEVSTASLLFIVCVFDRYEQPSKAPDRPSETITEFRNRILKIGNEKITRENGHGVGNREESRPWESDRPGD